MYSVQRDYIVEKLGIMIVIWKLFEEFIFIPFFVSLQY